MSLNAKGDNNADIWTPKNTPPTNQNKDEESWLSLSIPWEGKKGQQPKLGHTYKSTSCESQAIDIFLSLLWNPQP